MRYDALVPLVGILLMLACALDALAQDIRGVVDLHVHSDPDSVPRSIDAIDIAKLARKRGIRGVLLKNHYESTAALAYAVRKQVPGIEVFGGIALNRSVGGINPEAVDRMARQKGRFGKVVWMPTFDAENHVKVSAENRPHVPITSAGALLPQVLEVLDLIARNDLVLATGHSSPDQTLLLLAEARKRGIRRLLVTHPMMIPVSMDVSAMKKAAELGAKLEFVYNALIGPSKAFEPRDYAAAIRAVGPEHCILSSDLGQAGNPLHPEGFQSFLRVLAAEGISIQELETMSKTNPAHLLGLEVSRPTTGKP
ncbi:MAG TPA: DUF6282 family protein [Bryobacteraceae bacterium]|nr:DUF6282 family protein [Bryobacteraceae bacterium]